MAKPVRDTVDRYLLWAEIGPYAAETVRARRGYLHHFAAWLADLGVEHTAQLNRELLGSYQRDVRRRRTAAHLPIGPGAVTQRLLAVRGFLRWAGERGWVAQELSSTVVLPRRPRPLPAAVLTAADLGDAAEIGPAHVSEAVQYRSLDRPVG